MHRRFQDWLDSRRYGARVTLRRLAMAVSGQAVELFGSGSPQITMTTTAAVTAGRLAEITGDRGIGPAGASSLKVLGVCKQTGSAVGDKIDVATGGVWMIRASGAISAGDTVRAAAAGDVAAIAADGDPRLVVGIALAAIANAAEGPILLKIG